MTREELIKAIYDNEDTLSCPDYACDMPEKEGNTGECCLKCAEKQLKAYEDKIKAEAIDECIKLIGGNIKSIVGTYNKDTPLTDRASYRVAKNELIEELVKQLEQLKEQNK